MTRRLMMLVLALGALSLGLPSAAAGGGCHAGSGLKMTSSRDHEVSIAECAFQDTVTYVERGDSVTWASDDAVPHTVTGAAGSWGDDSLLNLGDEVTYEFEDEGVYPYYCALHPSMVGAVVVGDATAMLGKGAGAVKLDGTAAQAAAPAAEPAGATSDSTGTPALLAIVAAVAAGALGVRLALRRRMRPRPAA